VISTWIFRKRTGKTQQLPKKGKEAEGKGFTDYYLGKRGRNRSRGEILRKEVAGCTKVKRKKKNPPNHFHEREGQGQMFSPGKKFFKCEVSFHLRMGGTPSGKKKVGEVYSTLIP